ncbi:hypothetical protein ACFL60_06010 [Candidatus Omnitrophota bacterium]
MTKRFIWNLVLRKKTRLSSTQPHWQKGSIILLHAPSTTVGHWVLSMFFSR